MDDPEAPSDETYPREDLPHVLGGGVRGNVEVLRHLAEEQVADAAADEIGFEPGVPQFLDHGDRFLGHSSPVDVVFDDPLQQGQDGVAKVRRIV